MIGVEETESGLRVWDSANNEVSIETKGSKFIGEPCLIDRADESFRSILRKLIFPADGYSVFDSEDDQWTSYGSRIGEKVIIRASYSSNSF